jgi:hypothetical protein
MSGLCGLCASRSYMHIFNFICIVNITVRIFFNVA